MEKKVIEVAIIDNGKLMLKKVENTLKSFQSIVGGLIEVPCISKGLEENNIKLVCNEEGKFIEGLSETLAIMHEEKIVDVIFGSVIFCSVDNEGNFISLSLEQKLKLPKLLMQATLGKSNTDKLVEVFLLSI